MHDPSHPRRGPGCPRSGRTIPWHCRLETRVLICITLVAGLSLEVALLAAQRIVTSHSMHRSTEELRATRSVFHRLMKYRADSASAQCRLITELPVFRASIDKTGADAATVSGMAEEYRQELGAEF